MDEKLNKGLFYLHKWVLLLAFGLLRIKKTAVLNADTSIKLKAGTHAV